jgi:hypothetical protein
MPLAVLYRRFPPRPSPEDCDSVEKQQERCRADSIGHGYTVISEHHDKGLSGGGLTTGPATRRPLPKLPHDPDADCRALAGP